MRTKVFALSRAAVFALVALFSSGAHAQALECGKLDPADCFASYIRNRLDLYCGFDVFNWQALAEVTYRMSGPTGAMPAKPDTLACVAQQKSAVKPYYDAARAFLANSNNKDGLSALKDAYSYWLTSADLLPDGVYMAPTHQNVEANRAQTESRERGLKERLNRLALEK